ncbi:MAG: diiron oxygenase, partial [Acidimicrobiales bacterium]|nr:diiron oxygenase [Acidimicrobiales bacterium]
MTVLADRHNLDTEITPSDQKTDSYVSLIKRLSTQSVEKHFDAYADIDWDSKEMAVDPDDPRWILRNGEIDPLGLTAWYKDLDDKTASRIGLHMVAMKMKIGLQFEGVLKRGLLGFAAKLPNNSPEFRYCYHEVIEEAQHSLMFQEFVNRSGLDVPGLSGMDEFGANTVVQLGRRFPPLFFFFVLGGEDPIDFVQRKALRSEADIHPLLERIMRIHVTEEARHLSFARNYLKKNVPSLDPIRRQALAMGIPAILGSMAQLMMQAPSHVVKTYEIPKEVVKEAYGSDT